MGYAAIQVLSGATQLSELGIDISKNWLAYLIKHLGAPIDPDDAARLVDIKFSAVQTTYAPGVDRFVNTIYTTGSQWRLVCVTGRAGIIKSGQSAYKGASFISLDSAYAVILSSGMMWIDIMGQDPAQTFGLEQYVNLVGLIPPLTDYEVFAGYSNDGYDPEIDSWVETDII